MIKKILISLFVVIVLCGAFAAWVFYGKSIGNIHNYEKIGDIPAPLGYERINQDDGYAQYLRSLPLHERGHKIQLYTGGDSRLQNLNYAVIDLPLLSNDEQCADVCMRLRAEYLYNSGQSGRIHFMSVNGNRMNYGGGSRKAFESYMRKVYGVASTYSLSRELPTRPLADIQPGDIFVYAGVDRGRAMGHAVMVVDVAQNKSGDKVFMIAEGNTPAREIHILRNWFNPFRAAWFSLDEDANVIRLSPFKYYAKELKYWN